MDGTPNTEDTRDSNDSLKSPISKSLGLKANFSTLTPPDSTKGLPLF